MRIIVFTGKGGVGKTSVAAATATRCAALGYRTIIMSTDAAHSLADSLDTPLGPEPIKVSENLWAQEVNPLHEMERNWGTVRDFLLQVLAWQGTDDITTEEMAIIPGTEELFSLVQIKRHHDSGDFDVIIVDAAPTGETLRLLSLPDVLKWWLHKLFPSLRNLMRLARPVMSRMTSMPLAGDDVFASLQDIMDRLEAVRAIIADPKIASARVVLNLEKMVIKEAQRSLTYLNLFGYNVDQVVINRVVQEESLASAPTRAYVSQMQDKYRKVAHDAFAPLPMREVPQFEREVVGAEMLTSLAEHLYGDDDPTAFFFSGQAQQIFRNKEGNFVLAINLPFVEQSAVSLIQNGDDLVVEVGWHRRNIVLPSALARQSAARAIFVGSRLEITFEGDTPEGFANPDASRAPAKSKRRPAAKV